MILCVTGFPKWLSELIILPMNEMITMTVGLWFLNLSLLKYFERARHSICAQSWCQSGLCLLGMKVWSYVLDIFILFRVILGHFHPHLQKAASLHIVFQRHTCTCCAQCEITQLSFTILGRENLYIWQSSMVLGLGCIACVFFSSYLIIFILNHGLLLFSVDA